MQAGSGHADVQAELQDYLNAKGINNLFIKIVEALLLDKPDNPVTFIVEFLKKNYPNEVGQGGGSLNTLAAVSSGGNGERSDTESDEDDEEDMVGDMMEKPAVKPRGRRISVSAESVDPTKMKTEYLAKRKIIPKDDVESKKIEDVISKNMLFKALDADQKKILVEAVDKAEFGAGDIVMKQGDAGDYFYIIAEGKADVFVKKAEGDESKDNGPHGEKVMSCKVGDSFGDLALMYNAPRAATVQAVGDLITYKLDRTSFKVILFDTTTRKREKYDSFLQNVPILSKLSDTERKTIADVLDEETYQGDVANRTVIKQGDNGDYFFIIKSGRVSVTQQESEQSEPKEVACLEEGAFFGEIALLTDRPRQATCTVPEGETAVMLSINRAAFTRVLGGLTDILKRDMETYHKFVASLM